MTFTNSILAGTTLVRESISSEGYVAGSTGWQIERDGDAEFNEVDIRGEWTVTDADPDEFITCRVTAGSPILEFGRDGITYRISALSDGTFGERLSIGSTNGATPNIALVDNLGSGDARIALGPVVTGARAVLFLDGYLRSAINYDEETWHAVTFQNAFANIGGGFHNVEYQINALGRVELRGGALRVGATADGTALFTLPVGYRPTTTVGMVVHNLGTSTAVHPRIRVFSTGVVVCYGYSAGGIANTAFAMDGLSFPLEA